MNSKRRKTVGIIFGGQSNEHDVSIKSAKTIFDALNSKLNIQKFSTKIFYVNKHGFWFSDPISLSLLKNEKNIRELNSEKYSSNVNFLKNIDCDDIDIWFPVIHGFNGEDGTIQGLLKLTQKSYVSSGLLGSVLGMDKITMKLIFSYFNIPQVKYFPIQNYDLSNQNNLKRIITEILKQLKFPIFIKPSNSGSSMGISKVSSKSELIPALKKALKIDKRIIAEEGLEVRELECSVIGKSELKVSEVGEVNYFSDWYDYESKYTNKNKIIIPANINLNLKKKIQELTLQSCQILNIDQYARVDFFLEKKTNKVFLNEINTIPGFTNTSMFPLLWKASGLEIDQLVARLIEIAFEI